MAPQMPGLLKREKSFLDKTAFNFPSFTTKGLFDHVEHDLIATVGEFIGTVLFLLVSLGAVQNVNNVMQQFGESKDTAPSPAAQIIANFYISAASGLALYCTATVFYRFTGSIFNPAICLSLLMIGSVKPLRFILVCSAQFVAAVCATAILHGLSPGKLQVELSLGPNVSLAQGLFIEMFATALLVLSVLMLGAEKHLMTPMAPTGFAASISALTLWASQYTGAALNPARAFGTSCIIGWKRADWIYWVGPTLGAVLSTVFYLLLKAVHYWDINPGQDSTAPLEAPASAGPRPDMHPNQTEERIQTLAARQV